MKFVRLTRQKCVLSFLSKGKIFLWLVLSDNHITLINQIEKTLFEILNEAQGDIWLGPALDFMNKDA